MIKGCIKYTGLVLLGVNASATARVISRRWNDDDEISFLVEETGVPGGNHRPTASNWNTGEMGSGYINRKVMGGGGVLRAPCIHERIYKVIGYTCWLYFHVNTLLSFLEILQRGWSICSYTSAARYPGSDKSEHFQTNLFCCTYLWNILVKPGGALYTGWIMRTLLGHKPPFPPLKRFRFPRMLLLTPSMDNS